MESLSPDDAASLQIIEQAIYAPGLDVTYAKGSTLIGKLPGGPLRYLHKLFSPKENAAYELEKALGFPPPLSYEKFFSLSDGATLFDNTLFLYGIEGTVSREVSIDNVRPISLIEEVEIRRITNPDLEWIEVGGLSAATKSYSILLNQDGVTVLRSPDGAGRESRTFLAILLTLFKIMQNNSGPLGLIDGTAETLQAEIDSFIGQQRQ